MKLRRALAEGNGSPAKAALILGVSRMTVWRRMKKYGLQVHRVVKAA